MSKTKHRVKVGELRPSQVLTTFGVGSIVDLPNISVMVMGLNDWPLQHTVEIGELRLLASVKEALGPQVAALRSAPVGPETTPASQFDGVPLVGIPVTPFPRWVVCPYCRRLAPLGSGLFTRQDSIRTDQVRYVHGNCTKPGKPPTVVPARFIVACKNGHLDDFPWHEFVHHGPSKCDGGLKLFELSVTGEAAGIEVRCEGENCKATRRMSDAFKIGQRVLPTCRGRRPHLRDNEENPCIDANGQPMQMRPMLQGASNAWFGITLSALAIPEGTNRLSQLVDDHWPTIGKVTGADQVALLQTVMSQQLSALAEYPAADIWSVVQAKQAATASDTADDKASDLKTPEWEVFSGPSSAQASRDFQLSSVDPPARYSEYLERVVLVERLREVRALIGFTRIESPSDFDNPVDFPPEQRAKLTRQPPLWVPASETRGEGLFFHFREDRLQKWLDEKAVEELDRTFYEAHRQWRAARHLDPNVSFPGARFLLLHSFAHALIRQLAVECGYTSAALRERIYSRGPEEDGELMSGVLIYTAAPDSEGTLGGLVSLGRPETLERHLDQALDSLRLCASDPLCSEHHPSRDGITLHGASCHACLFAPETSCERSNKYLDRSVLVPTVQRDDVAFFE